MKNKNSELAEQSIPDKWISWLFGHNVFIHLSGMSHSTLMFTVFPSPPAQSARPRLLRAAVGRADVWLLSAKSTLTGLSFPSAVRAWQAKMPCWHCSGVLQNQEGKCEFKQGPALHHTCLRELAFLSPSLENYCFRCFSKTTKKILVCLCLLLLSLSILSCARWWMYILVWLKYWKSKHSHLGKSWSPSLHPSPLPHTLHPCNSIYEKGRKSHP